MATLNKELVIEKVPLFRTQYDRKIVKTEAGRPDKDEYGSRIDKNGALRVEKKGVTDMYNYIQSFADSTDINVLMKRFANGEVDVLNQKKGFYADVTNMPTTYAEMLNKVIEAEQLFNELPVDLKEKYGNSYAKWLAASGTDQWMSDMKLKGVEEDAKTETETMSADAV